MEDMEGEIAMGYTEYSIMVIVSLIFALAFGYGLICLFGFGFMKLRGKRKYDGKYRVGRCC